MTNSNLDEQKQNLSPESNEFWTTQTTEQDDDFILNLLAIDQIQKEDFDWLGFNNLHLNYQPNAPPAVDFPSTSSTTTVEEAPSLLVAPELIDTSTNKTTVDSDAVAVQQNDDTVQEKEIEKFLENSFKSMAFKQKREKKSDKKVKKISQHQTFTDGLPLSTTSQSTKQPNVKLKRQRNQQQKLKKIHVNTTATAVANSTTPATQPVTVKDDKDVFLDPNSNKIQPAPPPPPNLKTFQAKTKNVDLHIEQFSQLDLHSSEDDSELLIRNSNRKLKNTNSCGTTSSSSSSFSGASGITASATAITSLGTSSDFPAMNNEFTKRTKYSSSSEQEQQACVNTSTATATVFAQPVAQQIPQQLKRKKLIEIATDTLNDMKNLNLNQEQFANCAASTTAAGNGDDKANRKKLWNFLKENASKEEIIEEMGPLVYDKVTFWDLVKMKLKHGDHDKLKLTYSLLDDYTLLYSNMSKLLENIVSQHSATSPTTSFMANKRFHFNQNSFNSRKSDNSSRSRSSSRNYRKPPGPPQQPNTPTSILPSSNSNQQQK